MRHSILVVDDEPASLRAVTRTLADEFEVVTAADAAAALAQLATRSFAMIVADECMPGMHGNELLACVAAEHPDAIRVLLTGYTDIDTLMEAINAGHVYAYLTKPWDARELRLAVRRGIERYDADAERRRLMAQLERACTQLRRESEQKSRLLALAAHELGTPIHLAAQAVSFMAAAGEVTPEWLAVAQRNLDWMATAVAQLGTAGRWRRGALTVRRRELCLSDLLRALELEFTPARLGRRLAIAFELPADLPPLWADPAWLRVAVWNLLSNAVRFTPDGGAIRVAVAANAAGVVLTVRDSGAGIRPELLDDIFEPFSVAGGELCWHASGRFAFGARGLGLGLATARAIVAQHGGTIHARSTPGVGSEFAIELPRGTPGV